MPVLAGALPADALGDVAAVREKPRGLLDEAWPVLVFRPHPMLAHVCFRTHHTGLAADAHHASESPRGGTEGVLVHEEITSFELFSV